jgi:hypothetical protein
MAEILHWRVAPTFLLHHRLHQASSVMVKHTTVVLLIFSDFFAVCRFFFTETM